MDQSNDSSIYMSQTPSKNEQQKYKKIKVLGQGSMGRVYLVQCKLQNNKQYVMKRINIGHLGPKQKQQALLQAQLHNMVRHQNIIEFKQIYHTTKDKLCIIMEYADGGDLDQLLKQLKQNQKSLTQDQILKYFTQICLALRQIHEKKIVHRDLKGANIFLSKDGKIKLGDFGISKAMDRTVLASKSFVGTPFYLSPQMVQGKPYSTKADIWALGVVLYHMTALRLPFDANSLPVLALKILKGSYPQIAGNPYSKDLKLLISSLLQVDQRKRPSVIQILCKPIMSKYLLEQFIIEITPKIKAKVHRQSGKVRLATDRSKLATDKSKLATDGFKTQFKVQNQKLAQQHEKKGLGQKNKRRQQSTRKMNYDTKAKGDKYKNQSALIQAQKPLEVCTAKTAQISKKKPKNTIYKPVVNNIKPVVNNIKPVLNNINFKETKQQSLKSLRQQVQEPRKNRNMMKQQKQPQIQILVPSQTRMFASQQQQVQVPPPKIRDYNPKILIKGQNPYLIKNIEQKVISPFNNSDLSVGDSHLISQDYQQNQQIQQQMQNNAFSGFNIQDLLANVHKAQSMVNNLSNPYQNNNIQLYQQSSDFENTMDFPKYDRNAKEKNKQFQNNGSDIQDMKYIPNITDSQNLKQLRQILQDRLGQQEFSRALNIVQNHFQEQISSRNAQETSQESQTYLFDRNVLRQKLNFLTLGQFDTNIQLIFTIFVMGNLQMMKIYDTQQEDFSQQYQQDQSQH